MSAPGASRDAAIFTADIQAKENGVMSDMIFDQQDDAPIGLVCQWHRSAQGPLTCTWTEVPSARPDGARYLRLPDFARVDHFTCASRPESRLQVVSRWIAMTVLLASAALGTFLCFVTEPGDLL
jgi:hypothetical protein